jgi:twitching motility protein PilU
MDIGYFLKLMTDKNASDMFLTTGAPVHIKVEGKLYPLGNTGLPPGMVKKIAYSLMDEGQVPEFEREMELPGVSASTCSSNAAKWAWSSAPSAA